MREKVETLTSDWLDAACAQRSLSPASECGDLSLVRGDERQALVAVIDGLGHGRDAAFAAGTAVEVLRGATDPSTERLMRRCHEAAFGTRGLTMGLARYDRTQMTLTWLGVGNVQGLLIRGGAWPSPGRREPLFVCSGVVGHHLSALHPIVRSVRAGDLLLAATDGIESGFAESAIPSAPAQEIANRIIEVFAKREDDALIAAAKLVGRDR